ncbi:MAG: NADH-quinone oxidoreductase subunit F [Chloroflexi bacterium B3_Chlor]|nr:MAG: NADH-quinone oxidoreductase subunit F [Chloroflexi bacterium B3_Chlor]
MKTIRTPAELEELRGSLAREQDPARRVISLCGGTGCRALGSDSVFEALVERIEAENMGNQVTLRMTGCPGFCEKGPLMVIQPEGIFYHGVKVDEVPEIVTRTLTTGEMIDSLLYVDPSTGEKIAYEREIPFYKKQRPLLLEMNEKIDPTSITDYIALGGYGSLSKVLSQMTAEEVIDEVTEAKLRGRGGAGFPTGLKWRISREAPGDTKYVVCNADEGDPGAFMDRAILEGNPHRVLEGMVIGGYAIGADEGFVYVRAEYPLAAKHLAIAITQAREYGLLGKDILGSGFDFDVQIRLGAGAFVCGEETALMASIEGRTGEPRPRPPYPSQSGLWGKPTNINNVKTWGNVPIIIENGADWYAELGTEGSKGTKIFSVVGKINNTGLVEVPMGTTLRQLIFDVGGGIPNDKEFKAVQIGGPSGGCIPKEHLDTPIDYESLTELGAMMGSGGMVVTDEDTCMVDFARFFMNFVQDESCGKCVPCRLGTRAMLEVLTRITEGKGQEGDMKYLAELGQQIRASSLCGLGQTAPNPVLSTLRYFPDEYEAHIRDKSCPAHVCRPLIQYFIDVETCNGCGRCLRTCPAEAISGAKKERHVIDQDLCIKCGSCQEVCRFDAVIVE